MFIIHNDFPYSQFNESTTIVAPSGPPLDIRAEAKSSTELVVTWEPPQRDMWNGNLLGYYVGYQEVLYKFLLTHRYYGSHSWLNT